MIGIGSSNQCAPALGNIAQRKPRWTRNDIQGCRGRWTDFLEYDRRRVSCVGFCEFYRTTRKGEGQLSLFFARRADESRGAIRQGSSKSIQGARNALRRSCSGGKVSSRWGVGNKKGYAKSRGSKTDSWSYLRAGRIKNHHSIPARAKSHAASAVVSDLYRGPKSPISFKSCYTGPSRRFNKNNRLSRRNGCDTNQWYGSPIGKTSVVHFVPGDVSRCTSKIRELKPVDQVAIAHHLRDPQHRLGLDRGRPQPTQQQ